MKEIILTVSSWSPWWCAVNKYPISFFWHAFDKREYLMTLASTWILFVGGFVNGRISWWIPIIIVFF